MPGVARAAARTPAVPALGGFAHLGRIDQVPRAQARQVDHGVLTFERPPQQRRVAHVAHDALDGHANRCAWCWPSGRTSTRTVWPAACNSRTTTEPMKPLPPVTKTLSDRWVRQRKRGLSGGIDQRQHGRHSAIHFARDAERIGAGGDAADI